MPIFGADLGLQKIVEFKDFSRLLSDFLVLFKAETFQESPLNSSSCQVCADTMHVIHLRLKGPWFELHLKVLQCFLEQDTLSRPPDKGA